MAERRVERTDAFKSDVKRLARKHRNFARTVDKFLEDAARRDVPDGRQIPGLAGAPVFKVRLPLAGMGKRGGARLIYYCSPALVLAMYAYAKGEAEDIPSSRFGMPCRRWLARVLGVGQPSNASSRLPASAAGPPGIGTI